MLKTYLYTSNNWKQNRKTPSGSIFIAAFVDADGREITHSFSAKLQYLSLYLRLWVEIQHTNEVHSALVYV